MRHATYNRYYHLHLQKLDFFNVCIALNYLQYIYTYSFFEKIIIITFNI